MEWTFQVSFHCFDAHLNEDFKNKEVLEFGGNLPAKFVFECMEVKSWYSVVSLGNDNSDVDSDIKISQQKYPTLIEEVSEKYYYSEIGYLGFDELIKTTNSNIEFDIVYSTAACFEHVDRLHINLTKIANRMRKGGFMYSYFSPTWEHGSGAHWSRCPVQIPKFSHLYYKSHEMYAYFISQGLEPAIAHEQVYQIYRSPHINRLNHIDYLSIFDSIPGLKVEATPQFITDLARDA